MEKKLSQIEKRLLLGAWQDHVLFGRLRPYTHEVLQYTTWQQHLDFKTFKYVPADAPRWCNLGRTAAERKRLSRAYEALQSAGLLIRIGGRSGNKTTHVRLTRKGMALARTLNAEAGRKRAYSRKSSTVTAEIGEPAMTAEVRRAAIAKGKGSDG